MRRFDTTMPLGVACLAGLAVWATFRARQGQEIIGATRVREAPAFAEIAHEVFTRDRANVLSGIATDASGHGVPRCRVDVIDVGVLMAALRSGALPDAWSADHSIPIEASTRTDADGGYAFRGLSYGLKLLTFRDESGRLGRRDNVVLAEGLGAWYQDAELEAPHVIERQLLDDAGAPISGAYVAAVPSRWWTEMPWSLSDHEGRVRLSVPATESSPTLVMQRTSESPLEIVEEPPHRTTGSDPLDPRDVFLGHARDALVVDCEGDAPAPVIAERPYLPLYVTGEKSTFVCFADAAAEVRPPLERLAPGPYELRLALPGGGRSRARGLFSGVTSAEPVIFDARDRPLVRGVSDIYGFVTGPGGLAVHRAQVTGQSLDPERWYLKRVETDEQGFYRLDGTPQGASFALFARGFNDEHAIKNFHFITASEEQGTRLDLVLHQGAVSVTGAEEDEEIRLFTEPSPGEEELLWTCAADEHGCARMNNVPHGAYRVVGAHHSVQVNLEVATRIELDFSEERGAP
ncbi:MAG: carboxypeptidase-like regulatory domain-containing protein [Planctomycetota bacterium]